MVFSSLPLYLDPPNWQQQHPNPQHHEFQSPQVLPPPPAQQGGGGAILMGGSTTAPTSSSVRPGSSMADRARQAKIPVPEGPLKCPRCESTNTKFCYFNNYSLSQPRHFCKTCRRYWTRGGSLRSVPVGGGCRRNKRKKSGRAAPKSPSKAELPRHTPPSATTVGPSANFSGGNHLLQAVGPATPPPFSFMASLQNLTQLGMGNLGLNFSALGMGGPNNSGSNLGGYGEDEVHQQGQGQQLPNLLAGFGSVAAASSSMYPFQSMEGMETASYGKGMGVQNHDQLQQAGVKMESVGVGVGQHHHQFWSNGGTVSTTGASGGLWSDLSGICSSSLPSTHTILR